MPIHFSWPSNGREMDFSEKLEARLAIIESKFLALKEVFNFQELVAYTGLSESYLYKQTCTGRIPAYRPFGKVLFFKRTEIDDWLLQNPIASSASLDAQAANYLALEHGSDKSNTKAKRKKNSQ